LCDLIENGYADGRMTNTRNEAIEFARRTRRNLEAIEEAAESGAEVHVVTQLALSLLGLVVFPKEKLLLEGARRKTLPEMKEEGWPTWVITRDDDKKRPTTTLFDIVAHVRNAASHGRLTFTSDSRLIEEVAIVVEDKKNKKDPEPYWVAQIEAKDLRAFCFRFLEFIDDTIG
jgi:hypothetical protein